MALAKGEQQQKKKEVRKEGNHNVLK